MLPARTHDQVTLTLDDGGTLTYTITNCVFPEDLVVSMAKGIMYELIHGETPPSSFDRPTREFLVHGV